MAYTARLSVVITNFNYAQYLDAAIRSVLAQSRPADELIVVDDGSTDGSRAILDRHSQGIAAIHKRHGGQASAFNAGFAAASGDVILFLDADDELEPDAGELIRAAWDPRLGALSYRMNLIDETGTLFGAYPLRPHSDDMRPEMLARGQFTFMPTSGNAFNRALLEPFLPLPEPRWVISADAVLIRLAALAGPIRQLEIPLARYRAHRMNNYYRAVESQRAVHDRAVDDAIDACLAAALAVERATARGPARVAEAFDLRRAALGLAMQGRREGSPGITCGRVLAVARSLGGTGLPPRAAWAAALVPAAVLATGREARPLDRLRRPAIVRDLAERLLGADLQAMRREIQRSRWFVPPGTDLPPARRPAEQAAFNRLDWTFADEGMILHRREGELRLLRPAPPWNGLHVTVELAAVAGVPVNVEITDGARRLAAGQVEETGTLSMVLDPRQFAGGTAATVFVRARPARRRGWRLSAPTGGALLAVRAVVSEPLAPDTALPYLASGEALAVDARLDGLSEDPDGTLSLRMPCTPRDPLGALELGFGTDQPPGLLTASVGEGRVVKARVGPATRMTLDLPAPDDRREHLHLVLRSDPDDPGAPRSIHLATVRRHRAESPRTRTLAPGVVHDAADLARRGHVFIKGWSVPGGLELADTTGLLAFRVPSDLAGAAVLEMAIGWPSQGDGEPQPRLAVTIGEEAVSGVTVSEEGILRVPLAASVARGWRDLEIAIHVAGGSVDRPVHARLRVFSLQLDATIPGHPDLPDAPRHATPFTLIADAAAALQTASRPTAALDLAELVRQIDAALCDSVKGHEILAQPQLLDDLLTIGAASVGEPDAPIRIADSPDLVRDLARAMLIEKPWRALDACAFLNDLPEPLLAHADPLARYLTAGWHRAETDADLQACTRHTLELAEWIRAAFSGTPPGSPEYRLALAILRQLRPLPLLFSGADMRAVNRAMGQALEAWHLSQNRRITLSVLPSRGARIRIAALIRQQSDVPEARILQGMLGALPADRFEVTVYTLERVDDPFSLAPHLRVVPLDWLETDAAVVLMRAAQPDIFWLGSYFSGHDPIAEICAHRIAPLQLATTAVSPATTGLRSFDIMLGDRETAEPELAAEYTERLVLADHRVQRFAPRTGAPDRTLARTFWRTRLGIPDDAVVLVSTAHTDKISQRLLLLWAEILAQVPKAMLVLYPFAPNWRLGSSRTGFARRVATACDARGVATERVWIQPPTPAGEIPGCLAGADLYLDSFPYTGAATIVEALEAGTPAIALEGGNQVGRQAASWLRAWGLDGLVAVSPAAYCDLAVSLAGSAAARRKARASMRAPREAQSRDYGEALAATLVALGPLPLAAPPRFVFHHMAKAGGTSCRKVFSDWFDIVQDDRAPWATDKPEPPVDVAALEPDQLLWSHFNPESHHLKTRYPAILTDPRFRIITFVRDPLSTALSSYFFERQYRGLSDPHFRVLPIDEHLCTGLLHPIVYHLSSIADDWQTALDRYWFVGTLERIDDCLPWLARALGRPLPALTPWLNRTERDITPSPAAVRCFLDRAREDYAIYREICGRMEAALASEPRSFAGQAGLAPSA